MDFFERQDQARRKTKWLVLYLAVSTLITIALLYWALAFILAMWIGIEFARPGDLPILWNPQVFLAVSIATLCVIALGTLYKLIQVGKGGGTVARMLGGRPLNPHSPDPDEQKLLNIVEEMAIASGTTVPEIYILDEEKSINAFAAGHTVDDAVVGVTRGAIQLLNRDELQGVIAHEFSHILNGDMRLNIRCMGLVHGILCLAIIGRVLMYSGRRRYYYLYARNRGGNPLPLIGVALYVFGSIGVFFGKLIKSAISRQREYLADAAAVQFTRNPGGLAGALKKIGGMSYGSRIGNPHAEEASHMFFGNALSESMFAAFATHPPLQERIRLLDPSFNGKYPLINVPETTVQAAPPPPVKPAPARGHPNLDDILGPAGRVLPAAVILDQMGNPTNAHLNFAAGLIASMPEELKQAAHESFGAIALVYALLLSPEESLRSRQLDDLKEIVPGSIFTEVQRIRSLVQELDPRMKLPLIELAMPALRQLSPSQYEAFSQTVHHMIEFDREIDLFEYALQKMLLRHLEPHFKPMKRQTVQYYVLKPLAHEASVLLSALAHVSHDNPQQIAAAFQAGGAQLAVPPSDVPFHQAGACGLAQVDAALNKLAQSALPVKKQVLKACTVVVAADGMVNEKEAEMLRAIADTLDCPTPPLISPG